VVKSPISDRRRSERLAELLDEAAGRGRRHHRRTGHDPELAELVSLTAKVAKLPTLTEPDAEFRSGLRAMLLAKIEREGIGATADARAAELANRAAMTGKTQVVRQVAAGHGRTRAAVLVGVTAGALALSGVSVASTDSLPGDALYPVKRSSERAQLALASSDLSRGQLHLEFANSRLREAKLVPAFEAGNVLSAMNIEVEDGVHLIMGWAERNRDPAALGILDEFLAEMRGELRRLDSDRPAATIDSMAVLKQLGNQVEELRRSLTD
jgi:Domain of unknown function (DUF5667)